MADFKTHITISTVLGVGYGATAYLAFEVPLSSSMLAAGLCSISGMLPDLDSDSGVPVRETMSLAAAVVPMLMIDRFVHLGLSHESIVLAGGLIYIGIRFGVSEIFKRFSVHRGMWHSLPAAVIVGLLAFLICSCEHMGIRLFRSGAVVLGFVSHLMLDEIWSIDFSGGIPRLKKSFGTALKLWGKSRWGNVSTYAKLVVLLIIAFGDPIFMAKFGIHEEVVPHTTQEWLKNIVEQGESMLR